ncbi:phosphatidylglycerophosphatase A [Desulfonema ishimotonii]|uniref:Phosphatidylglycerophosphatase A n=1 Tax=Desulfonema ishimotonii TaxID=45657 RepID=A0A401G260_9BACT|nr:phosphatidylglycerophosphatase A [Desulfonema ishimotonii]GBC63307.1 phosphatidylglycerophosphatase A [Desulfonema ishimotonii]
MKRPETVKDKFGVAIGSALGLGLSPVMPGTCGALLGVIFHALIALCLPVKMQLAGLVFVFLVVCAANNLLTRWAESYWESPDPSHFVLDEVAGYLFVPILFREGELWKVILWGFILFRIFDIFKLIPPARLIDEKLHGPWGILLDDLVSAGYAALFMYLIYWFGLEYLIGNA